MSKMWVLYMACGLAFSLVVSCNDGGSNDDTETATVDTANTDNHGSDTETPGTETQDTTSGTADTGTGSGQDTETQLPTESQQEGDPCSQDTPWECNPVTNAGCDDGDGCAWTTVKKVGAFRCRPAGTRTEFQPCSATAKCAAGFHCIAGMCSAYCCGEDDCHDLEASTDSGPSIIAELPCSHHDIFNSNVTGDNLGLCAPEPVQDDPCLEPMAFACDPVTNLGCKEDQACTLATIGPENSFFCVTGVTQEDGEPCNLSTGLLCKGGLQCIGVSADESFCTPLCCQGTADCAHGSCDSSVFGAGDAFILGDAFGVCIDGPPECPWTCDNHWIAETSCEGVGYHGFNCESNEICCLPIEDPDTDTETDTGKPECPIATVETDTATDTETETTEISAFTCIVRADIPSCPAVHYEMACGTTNRVCCESIDGLPSTDVSTGSDIDTGAGDSDTGSATQTESEDTGSEPLTDTVTETTTDTESDSAV